jgi:hypothetical protein
MITPSPLSGSQNIEHSNSLADLAARIKVEHTAIADALKDSLRHALVAGELLIEAKAQVPHGQWLPWLKDHCHISERTAQLYMRVAKNRADIETKLTENGAFSVRHRSHCRRGNARGWHVV